jgi:hypothetical protein
MTDNTMVKLSTIVGVGKPFEKYEDTKEVIRSRMTDNTMVKLSTIGWCR